MRRSAIKNVHKMRRQKELRGKAYSNSEGRELSNESRCAMFKPRRAGAFKSISVGFVRKDRSKRRMRARCRWQTWALKPFFLRVLARVCKRRIFCEQKFSLSEGRELSNEFRSGMFKPRRAGAFKRISVSNVQSPKGGRFQKNLGVVCSERPKQTENVCSLSSVSLSAQTFFLPALASA